MAGAATTEPVPVDPRPAVFMAALAMKAQSVASKVARLKEPIVAVVIITAMWATTVAGTASALPKVANAAPTPPVLSARLGNFASSSMANKPAVQTSAVAKKRAQVAEEARAGMVAEAVEEELRQHPKNRLLLPLLPLPQQLHITIPSFDPSTFSPLPTPTLPSIPIVPTAAAGASSITITSFSLPPITAESTPGAIMKTYSTTLTIYYYTVFVTTTTFIRTPDTFVRSAFTSRTTEVTALATDSLDAALIFDTLALNMIDLPTPTVTASDAVDFSKTHSVAGTTTAAAGRGSQATAAAGVEGVGAVSGADAWRTARWRRKGWFGWGLFVAMVVL
ncbi:MAG: hypothetical protein Q9219_003897 [cf. Caloplaca sp. 3 TL-2023]